MTLNEVSMIKALVADSHGNSSELKQGDVGNSVLQILTILELQKINAILLNWFQNGSPLRTESRNDVITKS